MCVCVCVCVCVEGGMGQDLKNPILNQPHTHTQGEVTVLPHAGHMSELSIEYQGTLQREKELARRYEDLFSFLHMHVKDSQVSCHILTALIDRLSDCRQTE